MTRSELIKRINDRFSSLPRRQVQAMVQLVFDEITGALAQERRVELRGFGAFSVRRREARQARNPRTSEVVALNERLIPYFRSGKELKLRLNDNNS